jgi:hypothetical protein
LIPFITSFGCLGYKTVKFGLFVFVHFVDHFEFYSTLSQLMIYYCPCGSYQASRDTWLFPTTKQRARVAQWVRSLDLATHTWITCPWEWRRDKNRVSKQEINIMY